MGTDAVTHFENAARIADHLIEHYDIVEKEPS